MLEWSRRSAGRGGLFNCFGGDPHGSSIGDLAWAAGNLGLGSYSSFTTTIEHTTCMDEADDVWEFDGGYRGEWFMLRPGPALLLVVVITSRCDDGATIRVEADGGDDVAVSTVDGDDVTAPLETSTAEDVAPSDVADAPYPEIYVRDTWGYEVVVADPGLVGGTCGVMPIGYDGCRLEIAPGWESTLCDEARRRCVPPIPDCDGGWCYVPPRSYLSGAASDGLGYSVDAAITIVPRGFYIEQTEHTQGHFADVMGYRSPYRTACGDDCPVTGASVFEAMEVANRMSDDAGLSRCYVLEDCDWVTYYSFHEEAADLWVCAESTFVGPECTGYRLPSRAEWELAARAGSPYCKPRGPQEIEDLSRSCDLDDVEAVHRSIFCGNADGGYRPCHTLTDFDQNGNARAADLECLGTVPTKSTVPNDFGLYEVLGNVAEYTQTQFSEDEGCSSTDRCDVSPPHPYAAGPEFAETVVSTSYLHLVGCHYNAGRSAVCASWTTQVTVSYFVAVYPIYGFRLVRTAFDR